MTALEEIEFLALSENRIEVLDALREGPADRRDLAARVGASQPTLSRILADFEERNWIERRGGEYEATATGRMVAAGITDLRETMETERTLRDVVPLLPTDVMTFDLRRLGDATITVPTRTRPNAPVERATDLLERADSVRIVSHAFNEGSLEAVHRRTVGGDGTFDGVFSADAVEALAADPTLRGYLRDLLAAPNAAVRVADGGVPASVTITDDAVHLLLRDDDGLLQAVLVSEDEAVLSWARDLHERYRADADPLEADALAE